MQNFLMFEQLVHKVNAMVQKVDLATLTEWNRGLGKVTSSNVMDATKL